GIIKNLITGRDVEIATISYGQGIALTPIQTVRALSILANGGKLVTPHIAKSIEYVDGNQVDLTFPKPRQVLEKETTDDVTDMLINVVDKALKKGQVKMERYSIAAKTGTAQIADPVNGGYYSDRYLHSFFGYFPAYNPKFIVFLYHVYPKGAEFASETLTDPFIQLTKLLINYYNIIPDR
ncbi:penicillin-binding protein 2, partial [bacterium]|nr:penicillin-binding protein 2 [bacterium]